MLREQQQREGVRGHGAIRALREQGPVGCLGFYRALADDAPCWAAAQRVHTTYECIRRQFNCSDAISIGFSQGDGTAPN